jgi:hypothetical protein
MSRHLQAEQTPHGMGLEATRCEVALVSRHEAPPLYAQVLAPTRLGLPYEAPDRSVHSVECFGHSVAWIRFAGAAPHRRRRWT